MLCPNEVIHFIGTQINIYDRKGDDYESKRISLSGYCGMFFFM
jgi:hypothetical protein